MKTLKKTLCLVLAVVMAVGVLVLPANAATFDDADEITHDEAVAVLSGLGIVNGDGTGNFDPDGQFTRAEAAILLAQVVLTPEDAALLDDSKAVFTDVPVTNYANKYITWAVEEDFIHGVGDNKFEPDRKLTGLELAALMLEVLGETLDSANLNNFVALKTKEYGLSDGITGYSASKVISREDAVQMMFNAMKYDPDGQTKYQLVGSDGENYGTFDTRSEAAVYKKLLELTDAKINEVSIGTGNILYKDYSTVKNPTDTDVFGRPTTTWTKEVTNGDDVTLYVKQNTPATSTTNKATSLKAIAEALKLGNSVTAKRFVNGQRVDFNGDVYAQDGAAGTVNSTDAKWTNSIGGYGRTVEVYKEGDIYCIYETSTKVDVITDAMINGVKDGKLTLDDGTKLPADGLKKNDVVLYTSNTYTDALDDFEVATPTVGKVTAKGNANDPYIRIDGGAKQYFALDVDTTGAVKAYSETNFSDTYDIYFANGYIVYMVKHDDGPAPAATKNYTYVTAYQEQAAGSGLLNSTAAAAKAQIVNLETGAVSNVDVAIAQAQSGVWYIATKDNKANLNDGTNTTDIEANNNRLGKKATNRYAGFVTYELTDDGKYVFTEVADVNVTTAKGEAKITGAATYYASTNTKMVYLEYTNGTYKPHVYNGYRSFVAKSVTSAGCVDVVDGKVVAVYVYATDAPATETDTKPDTRAIYLGVGETTADGTEYRFLVEGAEQVFVLKDEALNDGNHAGITADNVMHAVDVKIEGSTLVSVATITATNSQIGKTLAKANVYDGFVVIDGKEYYLSSDCVIYDATGDTISAVDSIAYPDGKTNATVDLIAVNETSGTNKDIGMIIIHSFAD